MPSKTVKFQFHPRLMTLLSDEYSSTERALKELVDNAWDADADHVWVTLVQASTSQVPVVVVKDDGDGMTEADIRDQYLVVARARQDIFGDKTLRKDRRIKGRKGIGKFAGLMVGDVMRVETSSNGATTTIEIDRESLKDTKEDLSDVDLPINVSLCEKSLKGTTVTMSSLNQRYEYPSAEDLKELLVMEYGRHPEFKIFVNDEPLTVEDLPGKSFRQSVIDAEGSTADIAFTFSTKKPRGRKPGITIRVGGKIVGSPSLLGLDQDETIPKDLVQKIFGEIEADYLGEDITSDFGGIIENSIPYKRLLESAKGIIREKLEGEHKKEMSLQKARLRQEFNRQLSRLPEHRRAFALKEIEQIVQKYYGNEAIQRAVTTVYLDGLEKDEYHDVLRAIDEAEDREVRVLAGALGEFGLTDMALMLQQAMGRLRFLDLLEKLALNPDTLEKDMHQALESSLWMFGQDFAMMSSNKTTANILETFYNRKFTGDRAKKRPDLLLAHRTRTAYTLIEFKRPSHVLTRLDEAQLLQYRDDLLPMINPIDMILVGGTVPGDLVASSHQDIRSLSYLSLISEARFQLGWLVKELRANGQVVV
ncbi:MAG: uncharacterized protein JWM80_5310 [Cyanobacteria bacterium RYN_339]|nr:uncharacterized protein [Cyanobacteria bacterium RYN_339]